MAVENLFGSLVMTDVANTIPAVLAKVALSEGKVSASMDQVEVSAAASVASTYHLARLPSNAVILPGSFVGWDDLASSGAPLLDIGLAAADGQSAITDDPDALNDGLALATASNGTALIKDVANWGKRLWELLGLSSDPGGRIDVYASTTDAACNTGGTLAICILWTSN